MKRSSIGSPRSNVQSSFPRMADSSSLYSTSQLEFMHYLGLERPKPKIQLKECVVMIETSKCKICKREFMCETDTRKHMKKRHQYLKRKKDNKRVRVVLKWGNKTFRDDNIDEKYLVSPERESRTPENSLEIKESDQKPLQISSINLPRRLPEDISKDFIEKGFVSISSALIDMKSAEKEILDKGKDLLMPSTSTACDGGSSPTSSCSDTDCILYISDVEMDLGELYEDVNPAVSKNQEDSDSDDGEIVFCKQFYKHDFESVQRRIQQSAGVEAAFDIDAIKTVNSEIILEPKVEPTESKPVAQMPVVQMPFDQGPLQQVPVSPVPNDPEVMDLENGDISDAETVILDEKGMDQERETLIIDLEDDDTQNVWELEKEDSYELTIAKQQQASTILEEDPDICIIEDDEPVIEVEPINPIIENPQTELTEFIKEFILRYAKETEAARNIIFNDKNNNQDASIFGKNLKNISQVESAIRIFLNNLGIKIEGEY